MSVHESDKLAARAIPTVFIGYPANQKGYRLYDPSTHTTHTSRHVEFHKKILPFKDSFFKKM